MTEMLHEESGAEPEDRAEAALEGEGTLFPVEGTESEEAEGQTKEEKAPERQYPIQLSDFIASIIPAENLVTAIYAGDGSVFDSEQFNPEYCLGLEPEEKLFRKRQGTYTNLGGEFDKALTLLDPLEHEFQHVIVDLTRNHPSDCIPEIHARQDRHCATIVIQRQDQVPFATKGLACTILVDELDLAIRIVLRTEDIKPGFVPVERAATLDTLDLLGGWASTHVGQAVASYYHRLENQHGRYHRGAPETWRIVHKEYGRRFIRDAEARAWDLQLVGKKLIQTTIGGWATKVLQNDDTYAAISALHNKTINTFAQDPGAFDLLMEKQDEGILFLDPRLVEMAEEIVKEARFVTSPLYELPMPMRTAFIREVTKLKCIKTDKKKGFERGKEYTFRAWEPQPIERHFTMPVEDRKSGDIVLREHKRQIRFTQIRINKGNGTSELFNDIDTRDIKYLIRHFRLPNPGSLATRYNEKFMKALLLVERVESEFLTPRGLAMRDFQRRDIAMHLAKGSGVLAWEQGLGKTLGGLVFAFASFLKPGTQKALLVITAQDLMLQWKREAKKFLGIELEQIGGKKKVVTMPDGTKQDMGPYYDIVAAQRLAKRLEDPEKSFIGITYYEALSQTGRKLRPKEEPFVIGTEKRTRRVPGQWIEEEDEFGNTNRKWVDAHFEEYDYEKWSNVYCPRCGQTWDNNFCNNRSHKRDLPDGSRERSRAICGYSVYGIPGSDGGSGRAPTIAHLLTNAFERGVIVVDEGTMIGGSAQGNDTQRSLAVRGLTARYRLLMTGTPIKNFIAQAFWLLWWTLGNKSKRFDYEYNGGRAKFADQFTVFQWVKNDEGQWGPKKPVGEVTNLSKLWRLFSSSITRRTQDNCGEEVQPVKYHVIETPLGVSQREQIEFMRLNSGQLFIENGKKKDPPERRSEMGLGALGFLDTKWNYACTMPKADPDWEWSHVPISNWTPYNLRTLETVMALVKQGRKVLLGTDLVASVPFLTDALRQKGVSAFPLVDESGTTIAPQKRAQLVQDFKDGEYDVLISTAPSMKLGHSLEVASAVVMHGLPWDYETFSQYNLRVRRLTSTRPIDVFIMLPGEESHTIVGRKWTTLKDKTRGIGKALDGVLTDHEQEPPDREAILRELREKGVPIVGNEVEESQVERAWNNTPQLHSFVIPDAFLTKLAEDKKKEFDTDTCPDCEQALGDHAFWGNIPLCEEWALASKETAGDPWFVSTDLASWQILANEYRINTESGEVPARILARIEELKAPHKKAAEALGRYLNESLDAIFRVMAVETTGEFIKALWPTPTAKPEVKPEVEPEVEPAAEPESPIESPVVTNVTKSLDLTKIREEIMEYQKMHEAGILTDEEWSDIKATLITRMKEEVAASAATASS